MRTPGRAVLTALTLALGAAACGGADPAEGPLAGPGVDAVDAGDLDEQASGRGDEPGGEPEQTRPPDGGCGPIENPPLQAGSHLIGDAEAPAPYSSTPPTSGWHSSGALEVRVHDEDDPLREPEQVSVLEADGVVITYRDLPAEDEQALRELVQERYDGRAALTPYDQLEPGEVAMTAWGTLQRCAGVDMAAIADFVDEHAGSAEDVHGH